jgi:hypothetical protein
VASRFETPSADEVHGLLAQVLLRAPRRRRGQLWSAATDIFPEVEEWPEEQPVVGVATAESDEGPPIAVLLARERPIDTDPLLDWFGFPMATIVTGEIRPAARPAMGGDSISGNGAGGDTGTLGCLVENPTGDLLILGCNHTLAGVNQGTVDQDAVLQPGAADGGSLANDALGTLTNYETIMLGGYHENVMDAAAAELSSPADVEPGIREVGAIRGVSAPLGYRERVQKVGWTTGHTFGTFQFRVSHLMTFPGVGDALFGNQYGIVGDDQGSGFAQRGDSGAAVLTEDGSQLAGMVIGVAEDANMAIASPIGPILRAFDVTPVM